MENVVQKQTIKNEISSTLMGAAVTITFEKPVGDNPGLIKLIAANAVIADPASTEAKPLPPQGSVGVNLQINSWVNGNIKKEDVQPLIDQLEIELLKIVNQ